MLKIPKRQKAKSESSREERVAVETLGGDEVDVPREDNTTVLFDSNFLRENPDFLGGVYSIVTFAATDPARECIFFKIHINGFTGRDLLCRFDNTKMPLSPGDRVFIEGSFDEEIFEGRRQQCLVVEEIIARYEFDLNAFLEKTFPDIESSDFLRKIGERMIDYADRYYGSEPDDLIKCLTNLSNNLSRANTEIEEFTEAIFGKDRSFPSKVRSVREFLANFKNDELRRPLQLLGVSDEEIKAICIPLHEAYKIALVNPYRIPEIGIDRAEKICRKHLRMEKIPREWQQCGDICRFVYKNLKTRSWTSTPIERVRTAFQLSFDKCREMLGEYQCDEDFGHLYYRPIKKKEDEVSRFISALMKSKIIGRMEPLYPGIEPSKEQDMAIRGCLNNRISILTGEAGTGKTMCLGVICRTILRYGGRALCVSYTGAASERMKDSLQEQEVLGETRAMTIHMAITMQSQIQELSISHVIFDEFSMVDLSLFYHFINAFSVLNLSYIFIGDVYQLEPMSYGNVMEQLMKTSIPTYVLTENFRSEEGILQVCKEVRDPQRLKRQDVVQWYRDFEDYEFHDGGLQLLREYLQFQYDLFKPSSDDDDVIREEFGKYRDKITIVNPFNRTVTEINAIFQEVFMEPHYPSVVIDKKKFYLDDRVMKLINNHSIEVMNGTIGKVVELELDFVVVEFKNKRRTCVCPFFSKDRFRKISRIRKSIGASFSPYTTTENNADKQEKSMDVIVNELEELKQKMLKAPNVPPADIEAFFELAKRYPFPMFGMSGESEFLSIEHLTTAYALTTRKAQGNQFEVCLVFINGKFSQFVTNRCIYTSISRSRKRLVVMSDGEHLVNSCVLTPDRFTFENLAVNINSRLPEELKVEIEDIKEVPRIDDGGFDPFDMDFDIEDLM